MSLIRLALTFFITSACFLAVQAEPVVYRDTQDNALVDVLGPDLYVFEVGEQVEPTHL